ncbi:ubiquinone biosynthesis mono0xygenase COQ6 [Spizellomyces punctatus DAOM BR117]|uniref:Ubiquinone biosynthesis monooxygenase COQ6, mitochondrial n=1 Tax=Spizellomyces punctatus (strain DAOM BR117) TaxID=645134 RepID=A0A0L0HQ28_SPIPD|nr:ubiquinone biosynthesis mono0xygenase COQ6 [Spizellomyces punctatus DAOM BR117]KND03138.1 ubiquinone biosynthesis mono0xygenase COQ6 [Spizellomyces punctatus DAOM BR117]|eukprot:XP_016611177.1 ubiquinone biosynthesis mono0xygenase COQ6 [Spizellomyces punctatus DAOM BR117]
MTPIALARGVRSLRGRRLVGWPFLSIAAGNRPFPPTSCSSLSTSTHALPAGESHSCDVCIVGGGTVGTALACALASSPAASSLNVALVEAGDLYRPLNAQEGIYSNRVSSLTQGTVGLLQDLQVWERIEASRRWPYKKMQVWDAIGKGKIAFDAATIGANSIAYIVENNHLQAALVERLQEAGNSVSVFNRAKVQSIVTDEGKSATGWPIVQLEDGRTIQSRLLVGADGANSKVRTFAGIDSIGWDYSQMGVVATLKLAPGVENDTAWQRFLPTGPIALLPLNNGYSSLVWSITPTLASRVCSLPEAEFVELLNAACTSPSADIQYLCAHISPDGKPLVDFKEESTWGRQREAAYDPSSQPIPPQVVGVQAGSRAAFPLRLRNSEFYVKSRVALIGDAAHTVHPLAGQGLNLGLADVESLAQAITDGLQVGQDIGHIHLLEKYAQSRYVPNLAMMKAIDSIGRLFGTDLGPVAALRSFGLNLTNSLSPVKAQIMRYAGRSLI